jgi:methylenetetrahydrofolate reductase (NADPH)
MQTTPSIENYKKSMTKSTKSNISDIALDRRRPNISFEFFPPKNDEMEARLWNAILELKNLTPNFVSVTYGAGGSTRERTHHTIKKIIDETRLKPAAHLTCIAASKDEIQQVIENYWQIGVRHIVALRGDMNASSPNYQLHPDGYKYASELVEAIRKTPGMDFEISVAGYPEKHPDALNLDEDIDNLKRKIDAGANRIITQFFFNTDAFLRFVDKCLDRGIKVPIIPGILPVSNVKQTRHFAKMCGATIPKWMDKIFEDLGEKQEARQIVAGIVACEIARVLYDRGVNDFHFYTLNRCELTSAICHVLGVR